MWLVRALLLVLAACNVPDKHAPEGDDDTNVSPTPDPVSAPDAAIPDAEPDTQPPRLVDVQPAPSSKWRHSPINLTFDEALDPASVAGTAVTATFASDPVPAAIAFDAPASAVITLRDVPNSAGLLEVEVSATISDVAGNPIAAPLVFAVEL